MNTNNETTYSTDELCYRVIYSDSQTQPFGISAAVLGDPDDCTEAKNLFFTEAEAAACCKWLAENEVYPITLRDVLENIYGL